MELECTRNNPALKLGCLILSNNRWFGRSNPHPVLYRQIADLLTSEVVINNQLLDLLDQLDLSQIDMGQLKIQMDKSINQKYSNVDSYVQFITSFGRKLMNSNLSSEQVTKSVKLIEILLNAEKVSQW